MRTLFVVFLLFIFIGKNYSQHLSGEAKSQFNRNKLYVVLTGQPSFDSALRKAMTRYWVHDKVENYITSSELKKLISDKNNSFVYPKEFGFATQGGNDPYTIPSAGILFFNGGRKNMDKYNLPEEALRVAVTDYLGYEGEFSRAAYRVPLMIRQMVDDFYESPRPPDAQVKWKEKILLVNENHLTGKKKSIPIQEGSLNAYPYKYEIMSESKIAALVESEDPNYILLAPVDNYVGAVLRITDLATATEIGVRKGHRSSVTSKDVQKLVEKIR